MISKGNDTVRESSCSICFGIPSFATLRFWPRFLKDYVLARVFAPIVFMLSRVFQLHQMKSYLAASICRTSLNSSYSILQYIDYAAGASEG